MRNVINSGYVMLMCMLSLFFIQPDFQYILAFLFALMLCCADVFLKERPAYAALAVCFFLAGFLIPAFACYYPTACYGLFVRRQYVFSAAACVLLIVHGICFSTDILLICIGLCAMLAGFLLSEQTRARDSLEDTLRQTMDDSTERDLLLTEKNRTLLEKQDYEIYTATLKERNRIAREIHDNVGHLLSRSILLVGAAKTVSRDGALAPALDSLDESLNAAMDSIRSSVHDLRDESVNLEEALRSLIEEFTFCPVAYCYDAGRAVPRDVKYSFISITKEALSNIMRHSGADKASVTIREHPAMYQLCIEDNGKGNAAGREASSPTDGMGLSNMKERVAKLGGQIHISKETGFRILITIPKRRQDYETDTDR